MAEHVIADLSIPAQGEGLRAFRMCHISLNIAGADDSVKRHLLRLA